MKLTLKEAIQSRKLKLIAKELESLARKDRGVKKVVDQLKKGKEPNPDDITSLKGDTQDEVVMAFASVIGPSKTSDFLGEEKDPCWDGYKQVGTKKKNGKKVPNCVPEGKEDSEIGDRKGSQPASYHKGLEKSTKEKRDAQFKKQAKMDDDNPDAYKPAPGDKSAETKPSKHTKKYDKMFGEHVAELEESNVKKSLQKKSEETGVAYSILKDVYDRGVAAWKTGHRPGTTPTQWGLARVNSFVTGGKTQKTTDKDLWKKHKKSEEVELDEAVDGPDYGLKGASDMAMTQLHFIEYAAEEVRDCLEAGAVMEEWYQNKLAKIHGDMEGLHSHMEGQKRRLEMCMGDMEVDSEEGGMSPYMYSEANHSPMHVNKAVRVAKDMGGNMTGAVEKIEKMKKGLSDHPKVKAALRMANEETEHLEEKAESKAQAIAARIALKHKREGTQPEKGSASAEMMKMSEKDLEDFTKAKKGAPEKVEESVELTESHYKVGQKVKCIESGMTGTVVHVDPSDEGKYYTVKREDGKKIKYAPDELKQMGEVKEALNLNISNWSNRKNKAATKNIDKMNVKTPLEVLIHAWLDAADEVDSADYGSTEYDFADTDLQYLSSLLNKKRIQTRELNKLLQKYQKTKKYPTIKEGKMDDVDKAALKKKFKNRKDKDIDNDGDVDDSDEYLHKRRKTISKKMKKEQSETKLKEKDVDMDGDSDALDKSKRQRQQKAIDTTD